MATQEQINAWFDWRERMNRRHRTMTYAEYVIWCRGGDLISDPTCNNGLGGGVTITLDPPSVIGKVDGWEEPPSLA
jgi:hypothetical protein